MTEATRFFPPKGETVEERKAAGKWSGKVSFTIEGGIDSEMLAAMTEMSNDAESTRRAAAVEAATAAGVGLRVDVLDWSTEYYLDPAVPVGEVVQNGRYWNEGER